MAHDLHVFNNAFNLPHMCGEEGCDLHARDADLHGLAPERLTRDQASVGQ